ELGGAAGRQGDDVPAGGDADGARGAEGGVGADDVGVLQPHHGAGGRDDGRADRVLQLVRRPGVALRQVLQVGGGGGVAEGGAVGGAAELLVEGEVLLGV